MAQILRACLFLLAIAIGGNLFIESASAQRKDDPPPPSTARYWPAGYGIVLMGIVLGLLIVLRPGTRAGDEQK